MGVCISCNGSKLVEMGWNGWKPFHSSFWCISTHFNSFETISIHFDPLQDLQTPLANVVTTFYKTMSNINIVFSNCLQSKEICIFWPWVISKQKTKKHQQQQQLWKPLESSLNALNFNNLTFNSKYSLATCSFPSQSRSHFRASINIYTLPASSTQYNQRKKANHTKTVPCWQIKNDQNHSQ